MWLFLRFLFNYKRGRRETFYLPPRFEWFVFHNNSIWKRTIKLQIHFFLQHWQGGCVASIPNVISSRWELWAFKLFFLVLVEAAIVFSFNFFSLSLSKAPIVVFFFTNKAEGFFTLQYNEMVVIFSKAEMVFFERLLVKKDVQWVLYEFYDGFSK